MSFRRSPGSKRRDHLARGRAFGSIEAFESESLVSLHLGMIGLGRMGASMARRLARGGVEVVGFDPAPDARAALAGTAGCSVVEEMAALIHALPAPRVVWLMVPAGETTEETIAALAPRLAPEDVIVDGGNAFYKDSVRRAVELASYGVRFVDCGVSGGIWGLEQGYALMFGGSPAAVRAIEPIVKLLAPAPDRGWLHCGPSGSGHFVKMIHNGVEYGMMQSLAEGLALLKGKAEFGLDVAAVAEMWRHGSVVRSWLLDLTAAFLREDAELADIAPLVADSGEGRWTVAEAIEQGIPAPVLSLALQMRFASQGKGDYADRLLAMMRKGFGGHKVASVPQDES
ncbi:MAG TPA: decarboxylating 6-phosphogluconate dehydrogenase [Casimicrobiaceae bacterium]